MDKQRHNGIRQPGIIPVKILSNYHTCTCLFPDNRIAVVHVQGAPNQKEARAHVRSVWYPHSYEVCNGDLSAGHAEPFYLRLPEGEPVWLPDIAKRGMQSRGRIAS